MIVLGLICIVVGWLLGIGILTTIGVICLAVGLVLLALGTVAHRPVGGRRHYF